MSDFCWRCLDHELYPEDPKRNDFFGLCPKGQVVDVLCEGCGPIKVQHEGKPVSVTRTGRIITDADFERLMPDFDALAAAAYDVDEVLERRAAAAEAIRPKAIQVVGKEIGIQMALDPLAYSQGLTADAVGKIIDAYEAVRNGAT